MSHVHNIIDDNGLFVINPITRVITTTSTEKLVITQYDHDSERYTFRVPRFIEEHDMSLCDRIEVHFTNITRNKQEQKDDVYIIKDVSSDHNDVFFSWLVSRNATQLIGSLKFSVTFLCFDDNGNEVYNWGTSIFDGIQVIEKYDHTEEVLETNSDLYESLKQDILDSIPPSSGGVIDKAEVEKIVKEYIETNPPASGEDGSDGVDGKDGISPTVKVEEIAGGYNITITDVNGDNSFTLMNGVDGQDGRDGRDGYTPVKGVDYYTETEKEELIQTIISRLLASDDLKQVMIDLWKEIGGTTPSEENEVMLVLGGEDDESDVTAVIDDVEYPVLNADSPVLADDGEAYNITIS